jgi:signal transduction histidine kinase
MGCKISSSSATETILVVDDIPANVNVLLTMLTEKGFTVLVAKEGKDAIRKVGFAKPDLILLDVMMPGMDGFEVCKVLKSQATTQHIPVIFMTALADTVDKVKGLDLGAADYITKPIQHEEVLARIHTQLKLTKLQKELQRKNQELEAFARTVAHDLKNPLNAIIGLSEMVVEDFSACDTSSEEELENVRAISKHGRKMADIIDALLLLSGVASQPVELRPVDMREVLAQVKSRLSYLMNQYQGEVVIMFEYCPLVQSYAPWLEEIWANYLSNGLKYGGRPPRLEIGYDSQATGKIRFWVRDNGPGLSEEAQKKLFTPFTRLHEDRAEGHGLGLSIVCQIVEKLGGEASVESVLGEGSLFYFTLRTVESNS